MDEGETNRHGRHQGQKLGAAGLCIGVGSFSDPQTVPGMAHFLEHMVFMGSEKYPKENSFDEFIKLSGGSDNASTDAETTVFYFECIEKYFDEALDRFSQFFKAPLMKREAMTRERESIESEFQMSVTSDSSRKEQLLCSLAKTNSPVNSFAWGNLITLRDNVSDEELYKGVHEFRKRHYSAHRMTLTVQARLSLDELQGMVLTHFSGVPSNDLPPLCLSGVTNVFDTPEFNRIYHVVPVKDLCQLDITWALPSLKNKYRTKPQHFLSHLLGDEGRGSLLSYLKKKCWVLGTNIGNGETGTEHNTLYTLFTVSLSLTEAGYEHLKEVIQMVFAYLNMLKQTGPSQRIFEELKSVSEMSFQYAHEQSPIDIVENLCEIMQSYPPEDYLTGTELYFDFDPNEITQLLTHMTPDKANYIVFKTPKDVQGYQTEKWFGTKYCAVDIPGDWLESWVQAPLIPDLSLPPPNDFITKDFSLLPEKPNNPDYPVKLLSNHSVELWYRQDVKFKLPMAHYNFYLISPLALNECKNACLLDILINLLSIEIAEDVYPAITADLSNYIAAHEKGLTLKVCGFNEKLPSLLRLIVGHLTTLNSRISLDMFKAVKDKLLKNYYNKALKPGTLAKDLRLSLLVDNNWSPVERYSVLENITCDDVTTYATNLFNNLYIKVLIQGNVSETVAVTTVNQVVDSLKGTPLKQEDLPKFNVVRVDKGERCCRLKNINPSDTNSVITNYYQSDLYTVENSVIADLIMMAIEEPLFDILRTKEQLGYHVYCSVRDTFGVLGYTVTVNAQASKVTAQYVDERIEEFMKHTKVLLEKLKEEEFEQLKENLIKIKQCVDVHLKEEVDRNFGEITAGEYLFDRIPKEVAAIQKTGLKQVILWWGRHNLFGTRDNFRKISFQIEGSKSESTDKPKLEVVLLTAEEPKAKQIPNYFITDISNYKKSVQIFNSK